MPLCQVNIAGQDLVAPAETRATLARALQKHHPDDPVIVLVHGYKFSPFVAAHDPHRHILALEPKACWKAVSWPRRLGLSDGDGAGGASTQREPLCIALGWQARGSLWHAYGRAAEAGLGLAQLVQLIRELKPGVAVQAIGHSLGARVLLSALPHLPPGALGRAVLMAAAEMQSAALLRLDCPAGRALEVLNVTSRENAVFDRMLEWLVAPAGWGDRALGAGLAPHTACRWADLRIDAPEHRAALFALGYPIPAADRLLCHWSVYLRPGVFDLYRAVLTGRLPVERLGSALPPCAQAAHGHRSRLGHLRSLPLPFKRGEV